MTTMLASKARQPWQSAIVGLHELWHGSQSGPPAFAGLPDRVRRAFEVRPRERGAELLDFARRSVDRFPYEWVHPTWLEPVIPGDPLLSSWVESLLPAGYPVHRSVRGSFQLSGDRPLWFEGWWKKRLDAALAYPFLVPGEVDAREPISHLFLYPSSDIEAILRVYGLRLVAAAIYGLDRNRVVDELYGYPPDMADRIVALVREREFPIDRGWTEVHERVRAERSDPGARVRELALIDLGHFCRHASHFEAARRVALALPRTLGLRLLDRLDNGYEIELGVEAADVWHGRFRRDIKDMVGQGYLQPPALDGELV